ncbi:hypothetical protein [Archangium sp.]|uniref:hypothetical protein n=1 Tax=Archangium sp. TaxID=1872627 RepID=UPI002D3C6CCF|nr:hypothetical protein [Archangium sp.]HYO54464.1 hypothetical protein [Archangium sp.]
MFHGFELVRLFLGLALISVVLLGPVLTRNRPRLGRWVAGFDGALGAGLAGWLIGVGLCDGEIGRLFLYGGTGLALGLLFGGGLGALASRRPGWSRVLLCYGFLLLPVPSAFWVKVRADRAEAQLQQRLRCHRQVGLQPQYCVEAGCEVSVECVRPEPCDPSTGACPPTDASNCLPRASRCEPRPQ